jgi:hypothetical protein
MPNHWSGLLDHPLRALRVRHQARQLSALAIDPLEVDQIGLPVLGIV